MLPVCLTFVQPFVDKKVKFIFTAEGRNGVRIEVKYEYYESSAAHPGRPPERYEDSFIMNSNESHTTGAYSRETFDVTVLSVKEI